MKFKFKGGDVSVMSYATNHQIQLGCLLSILFFLNQDQFIFSCSPPPTSRRPPVFVVFLFVCSPALFSRAFGVLLIRILSFLSFYDDFYKFLSNPPQSSFFACLFHSVFPMVLSSSVTFNFIKQVKCSFLSFHRVTTLLFLNQHIALFLYHHPVQCR